ncbi:MAG: alpha/beta hydrolase [Methanomassiliicoccales archaeon]
MREEKIRVGDIDANCVLSDISSPRRLVLLHGSSFSSAIWDKIGLLNMLDELKVSYVAPDLPGFGHSPRSKMYLKYQGMAAFVQDLSHLLSARSTVLMGASMGGGIAISVAMMSPEYVDGLALIGSVGLDWPGVQDFLSKFDKPLKLVWGSSDGVVPVSVAKNALLHVKGAELEILEGGHPVYLFKPERFNQSMRQWLISSGFWGVNRGEPLGNI